MGSVVGVQIGQKDHPHFNTAVGYLIGPYDRAQELVKAPLTLVGEGVDEALTAGSTGSALGRYRERASLGKTLEEIVDIPPLEVGKQLTMRHDDTVELIAGLRAGLEEAKDV